VLTVFLFTRVLAVFLLTRVRWREGVGAAGVEELIMVWGCKLRTGAADVKGFVEGEAGDADTKDGVVALVGVRFLLLLLSVSDLLKGPGVV
jgi:hypothetical protein